MEGVGADLKLGLMTAPVLYAWEEHKVMGPLIQRKFGKEGARVWNWSWIHVLLKLNNCFLRLATWYNGRVGGTHARSSVESCGASDGGVG